jgi:acyl-CoA thioester hydrolase
MTKVSQIRVLYGDTDQMGVVNYAVYLRWFEIGRAEWLRLRGRPYKELEQAGFLLPVVEAHLRYKEPARYDDLVDVFGGPSDLRAASVKFSYQLRRSGDQTLLCEGYTLHACLGRDLKVRRFPDELVRLFHPSP